MAESIKTPARQFLLNPKSLVHTDEAAEAYKTRSIAFRKELLLDGPSSKLVKKLEIHTARYNKVKEYFNQKIKELNLTKPLIFFDDFALRIDIGYGSKEMLALFPDFFYHGEVFDKTILGGVSFFGKSPYGYFLEDCITEDYLASLKTEKQRILSAASIEFSKPLPPKKKHQIKIIAIDSEATYGVGVTRTINEACVDEAIKTSKERYSVMNMSILERFREFDDGEKYLAFVGSGHVSTCLEIPGVSELLSCPNIVVNDLDEGIEEHIEQDILFGKEPETLRFDILYHRHQNTKQLTVSDVPLSSNAEKVEPVSRQHSTPEKSEDKPTKVLSPNEAPVIPVKAFHFDDNGLPHQDSKAETPLTPQISTNVLSLESQHPMPSEVVRQVAAFNQSQEPLTDNKNSFFKNNPSESTIANLVEIKDSAAKNQDDEYPLWLILLFCVPVAGQLGFAIYKILECCMPGDENESHMSSSADNSPKK